MKDIELTIDHLNHLDIAEQFKRPLLEVFRPWKWKNYVDILVVVDGGIATDPGVDSFGVGRVIELIRATKVGALDFRVDIAIRNGEAPTIVPNPAGYAARYRGFRFDMQQNGANVLDRYEQVWCFAINPGNPPGGQTVQDSQIDQANEYPTSNAELAVLARWMDEGGGLFGTGDHDHLGASMLRRVPRLGTMRRWTVADGVPTVGGNTRIDTLRPPSPAYMPGASPQQSMNNTAHQGDMTVQPIDWVPWESVNFPIWRRSRPHPVLCHPRLGPINVMPDHAHEGLCWETDEIDGDASFSFAGYAGDEYRDATAGGTKPMPHIIARGDVLLQPPYRFGKGPQQARPDFPMISIYDGHRAGVGRVATDSTWHHWMDVNIDQIRIANNDDWKKISRYFINLAVWLTPAGFSASALTVSTLVSHFQSPGFQDYITGASTLELGSALRGHLSTLYGPCWVTDRIWFEIVLVRKIWPWEIWNPIDEGRPPFFGIESEVIENLFLGTLVEETMEAAQTIKRAADKGETAKVRIDPNALGEKRVAGAFQSFGREYRDQLERAMKTVEAMVR